MNGIMERGTQRVHGATRREETHHQATPSSNVYVHLRSSEKFLPWRSQSQNTSEITRQQITLSRTVIATYCFHLNTRGLLKKAAHPRENGLFFFSGKKV